LNSADFLGGGGGCLQKFGNGGDGGGLELSAHIQVRQVTSYRRQTALQGDVSLEATYAVQLCFALESP